MTANVSSSSATRRRELAAPLAPLPAAFLAGRDLDLLAPLRFALPGEALPAVAAPAARREVAAELARANAGYGHPRGDELAARLADPATRVVVAGQQPGLFGGPLYTLVKLVAAARWAEALTAAGEPAVALFWVASEDHDYDEVAWAGVWSGEEVERITLPPAAATPLLPVGMRTLGPGVTAALERLDELFPWQPFADWTRQLARWYRPDARFGEAFCRAAVALAGPRCPLLVDAQLPSLKRAEAPLLGRLVERRQEVATALAAADERIAARGYALQVAPHEGAAPLFLLHGEARRRVVWEGEGRYALRGEGAAPAPVGELLATLAGNPAAVSPNVLSRPVVQDGVFGTCLQLLGPGELSYFPQAAPLYELLGVPAPAVALRPQVLLVEERHLAALAESGVAPEALLAGEEELDRQLADAADTAFVVAARERLAALLEELRGPALGLDANLERPWEKTRDGVLGAVDRFAEKVTRAASHRDEVHRRRLDALRRFAAPGGTLHERVLAGSYFRGRYGEAAVELLWRELDLAPGRVQILAPEAP